MSVPLIILILTGILAIVVLPFRRRLGLTASIASVGALLIGGFTLLATLEEPFVLLGASLKWSTTWRLLGRSMVLDQGNRAAVAFMYLVGSFIFGGVWIARPNRTFIFVGIISIGVVAASFMIQPFLFAAIFLEITAMGAVLILSSRESSSQSGSVRLLVLYTIGMVSILIAGWILESQGVTPATPELAIRATILLALGFCVLMAVPPFHIWLPGVAEQSNPYALAFVTILLQSAGVFFLLRFLDSFVWLRENLGLFQGIRVAAIVMICLGSIWALAQHSLRKIMAYALVSDFGVTLLAIGTNTPAGFQLAIDMVVVRAISLTMLGIGLATIENYKPELKEDFKYKGAAYYSPISVVAVITGLLSVAGFPLSAGFPGRWALIEALLNADLIAGLSVILSLACIGAIALRWLRIFLSTDYEGKRMVMPIFERGFMIAGVAFCLLLGIFPQLSYPWVVEAAAGMTQLFP
ncbi:MAG: proton-conducting transporter membrane subunit [Anaerolineales bacterium]|jgi:formate hydrogenlyase subunit 3/multisubunit Na+/H+ antiporter MnhD subunit